MIKITKNNHYPINNISQGEKKGRDTFLVRTEELIEEYESGKREFKFKSSIYGSKKVKTSLISAQNKKCCFCESKITHISHGDVEHFRPKGGYKIDNNSEMIQPGYYWLAYNWDNLFFSCQICNQKHKKNFFPLVDEEKRAKTHNDDLNKEVPYLINPQFDDPEQHLTFKKSVIAGKTLRGKKTIELLGLNREDLLEKRKKLYQILSHLKLIIDIGKEELKTEAEKLIEQEYMKPSTEYFAMVKSFFKNNE